MKKDFCVFYQCDVQTVYLAYQRAIKELFDKDADASPYHTLAFGIPPSFRYNMNGGACNVHFLPYNGGTAVNVRYSIVQLAMARCGAHNKHFTERVQNIVGLTAREANIPIEVFMNNKSNVNQTVAAQPQTVTINPQPASMRPQCVVQQYVAPQTIQAAPQNEQLTLPNFCSKCGTRFAEGARFCTKCGSKR